MSTFTTASEPDKKKIEELIYESPLISRDLSWLKFNYRVLEQAKKSNRSILDRLKFMAITASNLDEFMMIRVGSLYNYLDFDKKRVDYCGLREWPFKRKLFAEIQKFTTEQTSYFEQQLIPILRKSGGDIVDCTYLKDSELRKVNYYFSKIVYPMLTPMLYDNLHSFPVISNKAIIIGVETLDPIEEKDEVKYSFIQVPQNLPTFFEIHRGDNLLLVPLEEIIKSNLQKLYKNITIKSKSVFRITRNGDFDYDDYDEGEVSFVEEIQRKLRKRKTGRVVRLEIQQGYSKRMLKLLSNRFNLEQDNVIEINKLLDYTRLWAIVKNKYFNDDSYESPDPVKPLFTEPNFSDNLFKYLKSNDVVLHHPYQSIEPVIRLLEEAASDKNVLAIKMTIYRLANDSRITAALQKAAENGKHVSVLFEVKARFDEENNIQEGKRLRKAGCFVIYGIPEVKTHTKMLLIVRKDQKNDVTRYVHLSSGNYNESTAKLYTDTSFLTAKRVYANDVSEFFNVITGHSIPKLYKRLITTPGDMRKKLIRLVRKEASNSKKGLSSGIVIKVNSLEDRLLIEELYKASQAGVKVKLIVRGICCIRPGRNGLSENISVKSIVGDYLEHSRIFYFHNGGEPKIYGGSADAMVRSFDRRIESLFLVEGHAEKEFIAILDYSLRDEMNSFLLQEDGTYKSAELKSNKPFNVHDAFYKMTEKEVSKIKLFA